MASGAPDSAERPPRLDDGARRAVDRLIELLAADPAAPTTVTDRAQAERVHVADSLAGLVFGELRAARAICDVGSGAGFPGLVLAAALPQARVDLLESLGRKCAFIERAIAAAELDNARVVCERAETWGAGAGRGRLRRRHRPRRRPAQHARRARRPLLAEGGVLIAWKGRRDPDEEAELERASEGLAMTPVAVIPSGPYAGSEHRHLHLIRKSGATPAGIPRRPGMAKKRPRGS